MPGAGKTTLAQEASHKLGIASLDTDHLIEKSFQKKEELKLKISDIYRQINHLDFRMLERKVLKQIPDTPCIVSCGGGLPCYFDNLEYLMKKGVIIWLDTALSQIEARLNQTQIDRPVLAIKSEKAYLSQLLALYETRKKFYERANYVGSHNECLHFLFHL